MSHTVQKDWIHLAFVNRIRTIGRCEKRALPRPDGAGRGTCGPGTLLFSPGWTGKVEACIGSRPHVADIAHEHCALLVRGRLAIGERYGCPLSPSFIRAICARPCG
jgi:hypothetical protein